jgi:hypothetical protein
VYDQPLFLQTLSKFAGALPGQYDIDEVLSELADSVAAVLGLSGSGVSLAEDGRLRFVAAVSDASGDLERGFRSSPKLDRARRRTTPVMSSA